MTFVLYFPAWTPSNGCNKPSGSHLLDLLLKQIFWLNDVVDIILHILKEASVSSCNMTLFDYVPLHFLFAFIVMANSTKRRPKGCNMFSLLPRNYPFLKIPGNQILVGDIMRSVTLIEFDPEERTNRWICMLSSQKKLGRRSGHVKVSQFKQICRMYVFLKWGAEKQVSRSFPEMRKKLFFKSFACCGTCWKSQVPNMFTKWTAWR